MSRAYSILAVLLLLPCACMGPAREPVYDLDPGTRLVYRYDTQDSSRDVEGRRITVWVTAVLEDGGHEVYCEWESERSCGREMEWGKGILYPDGTLTNLFNAFIFRIVFPFVPSGDQTRQFEEPERNFTGTVYPARKTRMQRSLQYTLETHSYKGTVYEIQKKTEVLWDRNAGAPRRMVETRQGVPEQQRPDTVWLDTLGRISPTERAQRLPEIDLYLEKTFLYREQRRGQVDARPPTADDTAVRQWHSDYDRIIKPLQEAWRTVHTPELRQRLERMMDTHRAQKESILKRHLNVLAMLDAPAPNWDLEDIEGNRHHLEAYRGKVLLLYFASHWMPRSQDILPAMKALHEHFRGQPFALIGMDEDRMELLPHIKNAVEDLRIEYPVLMGAAIQNAYLVQTAPVFVVIDAEGIVRYHKAGYSHDLKDELIKIINQ